MFLLHHRYVKYNGRNASRSVLLDSDVIFPRPVTIMHGRPRPVPSSPTKRKHHIPRTAPSNPHPLSNHHSSHTASPQHQLPASLRAPPTSPPPITTPFQARCMPPRRSAPYQAPKPLALQSTTPRPRLPDPARAKVGYQEIRALRSIC